MTDFSDLSARSLVYKLRLWVSADSFPRASNELFNAIEAALESSVSGGSPEETRRLLCEGYNEARRLAHQEWVTGGKLWK